MERNTDYYIEKGLERKYSIHENKKYFLLIVIIIIFSLISLITNLIYYFENTNGNISLITSSIIFNVLEFICVFILFVLFLFY